MPKEEERTSGVSSSPPPVVLTAILKVINSPIFLITSLRGKGWRPYISKALGRIDTEAKWLSSRSSRTDKDDDRESDSDKVYLANKEASEGEEWKVDSRGGRPRRMRLPRMCVLLRYL